MASSRTTVTLTHVAGPFKCPFCPGTYSAALEPPSTLHSTPICKEYLELDIIEYLKRARERKEN